MENKRSVLPPRFKMKTLIIILALFATICPRQNAGDDELITYIMNHMHPDIAKWVPNTTKIAHRYAEVIRLNSARTGLDRMLIARLIKKESEFRWWVKSHKGAIGPMQVMPQFWYHVHKIPKRVHELKQIGNGVYVGCDALRTYQKRFKTMDIALLAYNRGPSDQLTIKARKGLFMGCFDDYVMGVMGEKKR